MPTDEEDLEDGDDVHDSSFECRDDSYVETPQKPVRVRSKRASKFHVQDVPPPTRQTRGRSTRSTRKTSDASGRQRRRATIIESSDEEEEDDDDEEEEEDRDDRVGSDADYSPLADNFQGQSPDDERPNNTEVLSLDDIRASPKSDDDEDDDEPIEIKDDDDEEDVKADVLDKSDSLSSKSDKSESLSAKSEGDESDDMSTKSDDILDKSDSISIKSDEMQDKNDSLSTKSDEISTKTDEISIKSNPISIKSDEGDEISIKSDEMLIKSDLISVQSDEILEERESDEMLTKSNEVSVKDDVISVKSDEILVKSDETIAESNIVSKSDHLLTKVDEMIVTEALPNVTEEADYPMEDVTERMDDPMEDAEVIEISTEPIPIDPEEYPERIRSVSVPLVEETIVTPPNHEPDTFTIGDECQITELDPSSSGDIMEHATAPTAKASSQGNDGETGSGLGESSISSCGLETQKLKEKYLSRGSPILCIERLQLKTISISDLIDQSSSSPAENVSSLVEDEEQEVVEEEEEEVVEEEVEEEEDEPCPLAPEPIDEFDVTIVEKELADIHDDSELDDEEGGAGQRANSSSNSSSPRKSPRLAKPSAKQTSPETAGFIRRSGRERKTFPCAVKGCKAVDRDIDRILRHIKVNHPSHYASLITIKHTKVYKICELCSFIFMTKESHASHTELNLCNGNKRFWQRYLKDDKFDELDMKVLNENYEWKYHQSEIRRSKSKRRPHTPNRSPGKVSPSRSVLKNTISQGH